ncbi:nanos homolog 2 [Emydura macquarii macquarii]|uniref:nanos homolog 2 n=1 Tax=Emydura macquarii macquarii TaxID=1129001 RepID=UPI00352AF27A
MDVMLPVWLSVTPSPPAVTTHEFDMWRDYLKLSKVVGEIIEDRKGTRTLTCETADVCQPGLHLQVPLRDTLNLKLLRNGSNSCSGDRQSGSVAPQTFSRLMCNFCRHNGESKKVYSSHLLKQADGTVVCPILRQYVCPVCNATGDRAHTLKYCPLSKRKDSLYCKGGRNSAGFLVKR